MMKRLKYLTLATLVAFAACDEGADPVAEPAVGTVTVTVTAEGENVDGATVTLTGATSTSLETQNGTVTFPNVVEGTYVVSLSGVPPDYVFGTNTATVTINTDGQTATVSFTGQIVRTASISGQVTANGVGVNNVTVTIDGPDGEQSTDANTSGNYVFGSLRSGTYTVTITNPDPDIYTFNTLTQNVVLEAGEAAVVNFGGTALVPGSISGTVTASGEAVEGATVTIDGPEQASRQTSAAGNYQFTDLTPGTYTVTLTNPNSEIFDCADTEETVDLASGEMAVVDFGCTLVPDPQVAIESITQGGLEVDRDNIMGQVEVTVNVRPRGAGVERVDLIAQNMTTGEFFLLDRETFVEAAPPEEQPEEDDAIDIVFQWRTDAIRQLDGSHPNIQVSDDLTAPFEAIAADVMRPYHPVFVNGDWELRARVVSDNADPVSAIVDVDLANEDALNLGVTADNTNWENPGPVISGCGGQSDEFFPACLIETTMGLRWLSGDIHITLYPIIYSQAFDPNDPLLQRASLAFDGFVGGADVTRGGGEILMPSPVDNTFTFSFCELGGGTAQNGNPCYASIAGLNTGFIGARNVMVATKTEFGQFGPGLANLKSISLFNTELQSGTGVINDVLRIDNEAPVPGTMDAGNLPHPANAFSGVAGFSRTGIGGPTNLGWVAWTDVISGLVDDTNSDVPNTVPDLDQTGADVATFCDPAGNCLTADGTVGLMGIGLPGSTNNRPNQVFVRGPDISGPSVGNIISGADLTSVDPITGADLPPETDSPGLTDQCPDGAVCSEEGTPFSDTELDYGITARHWDLFGNRANAANFLLLGVDGKGPIYSDALGLEEEDPTDATDDGTVWDTYDDDQHIVQDLANGGTEDTDYGQSAFVLGGKDPGAVMGHTTDRGNGFSGVAGVVVHDFEQGCDEGDGELACFSTVTSRWGFKLQPVAAGGPSTVLPFTFDGEGDVAIPAPGVDDFDNSTMAETAFHAYVATLATPLGMDGYRTQEFESYDRAGNSTLSQPVPENIADHDGPDVGNVQMPTVVMFDFTTAYTFNGEVFDQADLKKTDFSFDFNSIVTLQEYVDPAVLAGTAPGVDADLNPYVGQSLQLPLMNVPHTSFGSASIIRGTPLSISTTFLGCVLRIDEAGADPGEVVHRPRGPRWRSWDHSSEYGVVNTQFNTFVPTSVPACETAASMTAGLAPAVGSVGADPDGADDTFGTVDDEFGWLFLIIDDRPTVVLKGQTATFTPNVDFDDLMLYYLDTAGRAILLDTGDSDNWTLIVSDTGTGAFGRSYEYTYVGDLPDDLNDEALTNGTVGSYFFVLGTDAGHGLIWDTTSNP